MRVFAVDCPGCKQSIQATNKKSLHRHMKRHAVECKALRRMVTHSTAVRVENIRAEEPA